ncbi:response regulator [Geothrix limicola]|uniref:response regulator n=1 Tax=Geothrix limicola TaxID=2927978 RepID=UPI003B75C588
MRILLVEDDDQLGAALSRSLIQAGFEVAWVRGAQDGDLHLRTRTYDALLLDLGLPDGSGLRILRAMRRRDDRTPVIILTARDGIEDRVLGLDEGADDYLVKPFAVPELHSRIRALVRRSAGFAARQWVLGDLVLEPELQAANLKGEPVILSPREFQVLYLLARSAGRVVSRAQLEEGIFDLGEEPESNTIEVHIHRLRRKLGHRRIRTIRGLGYLLESA